MTFRALVSGKLHRDPIRRSSAGGTSFVTASLKVDAAEPPLWSNVVAFGDQAERLASLKAGTGIAVSGRASVETYEKNGETRVSLRVTADEIAATSKPPRERRDQGRTA